MAGDINQAIARTQFLRYCQEKGIDPNGTLYAADVRGYVDCYGTNLTPDSVLAQWENFAKPNSPDGRFESRVRIGRSPRTERPNGSHERR